MSSNAAVRVALWEKAEKPTTLLHSVRNCAASLLRMCETAPKFSSPKVQASFSLSSWAERQASLARLMRL